MTQLVYDWAITHALILLVDADVRQSCDQRTRLIQKAAPFSTQLSSVGTMVKVVNGKVQCRLCSKYPSCRWSPVCVAARVESKVNVKGGPADSQSLLSDHPLRISEYRLNLARFRETDRRQCQENRSPVFSYERSPTTMTDYCKMSE